LNKKKELVLMKRKTLALTLVWVLVISAVAGTQFIRIGEANPTPQYPPVNEGEVPPPNGTLPPIVSIFAPKNDTVYASNDITLNLEISITQTHILEFQGVYYKASWQPDSSLPLLLVQSVNLKNVPEGPQWIQVYAIAGGEQGTRTVNYTAYYVSYHVNASSIVNFTIDTTPPEVSIVSLENKTYNISNVPLNSVVSEPVSQIRYSLDGNDNVTTYGNTTLTGLANGEHNIKVYAWDFAGNAGKSESIHFNIEVPFPTLLVGAVSVAVALAATGILVYLKKRSEGRNP
jgi:hypothetical protein